MKRTLVLISLFLTAAFAASCMESETMAGSVVQGQSYWLQEVNGEPFTAQASLRFDPVGTVSGVGPCNGYGAGLLATYPNFQLGPIRATRAACPELGEEGRFFRALASMTTAAEADGALVLSNEAGDEMIFTLTETP